MSFELAAQLVANGLIAGSLYALIGVSWGLIFSTTRVFHFAHALTLPVSVYAAIIAVTRWGVPLVLGLALAAVVGGLAGVAAELAVYRPLRRSGAPQLNVFLASLGVLVAGESALLMLFGPQARELPGFPMVGVAIGPVAFTSIEALWVVGSWTLIAALITGLWRTQYGRAIRAVASNPELAHAVGIDPDRVFVLVFALGYLRFVGLAERAHEKVSSLAFGEQKLVALARIIATDADVLLLDEPAAGVDLYWVERMQELIRELAAAGKTICIIEHNLEVVTAIADHVYFMEAGRIIAEGRPRDLMADSRLAEIYFGTVPR